MEQDDKVYYLYRVASIAAQENCVQVSLQPAGIKQGPPIERAFCDPGNVDQLGETAERDGFVSVAIHQPERKYDCMPVTVGDFVKIGTVQENSLQIWTMPRPSPLSVNITDTALTDLMKQAQEEKKGMVFAVKDAFYITDAAILSVEEMYKLRGVTAKRP